MRIKAIRPYHWIVTAVVAAIIGGLAVWWAERNVGAPATADAVVMRDGFGYGEWRDMAGGRHAVQDIDVAAQHGARQVTALIVQCSGADGPTALSKAGWSAVDPDGKTFPVTEGPVPTRAGSPTIEDDAQVPAETCAYAEMGFAVPSDVTVHGVNYAHGGDPSAVWLVPQSGE